MKRCWLKGANGDALHTVLCAAGFNIRWLLRAIARGGIAALLFVSFLATLLARRMTMPGHASVGSPHKGRMATC